ncbi:hypothetical protein [Nostoc sp. PCC 9305]|uniref:hypothetical protein n=1 Tax=Nostoc sp. PCC 9305 TaxID=296636 RepID=UPI0039C65F49
MVLTQIRYILKVKKFIYEVQLYLSSRGTAIKTSNITLVAIANGAGVYLSIGKST